MNRRQLINWFMTLCRPWPKSVIDAFSLQSLAGGDWIVTFESSGNYYFNSKQHGTFTKATFDRMIEENNTMNRDDAIKWCKDYLSEWPDIPLMDSTYFRGMAKPLGWNWLSADGRVALTSSGEYVRKDDIFPPVAPAMPLAAVQPVPVIPKHVQNFMNAIDQALELETDKRTMMMTQSVFDKIVKDYPELKMAAEASRITKKPLVHRSVAIKVINDHIHHILSFVSDHKEYFEDFLKERDLKATYSDILDTLVHTDD